jgi:hypothetical protein
MPPALLRSVLFVPVAGSLLGIMMVGHSDIAQFCLPFETLLVFYRQLLGRVSPT